MYKNNTPNNAGKPWQLSEAQVTDEKHFLNRRQILKSLGFAGAIGVTATGVNPVLAQKRTEQSQSQVAIGGRRLTPYDEAVNYNNYFEFGSHKYIAKAAQALPLDAWVITIDGLVETPKKFAMDELLAAVPVEERIYRHRCVEAWSMVVPWQGIPLAALLDKAGPLSTAKYVRFESFSMPEVASGQRQPWYPWPYVEALSIAEARNELAFLATGFYGKPLAKQSGAPLRLVVPWKYGFKSIKGITRIELVEERPISFWEQVAADEYGFWANVNPDVPHPRWSQASERPLGLSKEVPTLLFNGYGEQVAYLYKDLQNETLYR
ncbi:protein-methionine-sulfoxide reductase catalytic subunit MsrP [Polycladidibacter stylochi]|uniref:protein-methionine-sulfoxide reductase catalytic subunit MsrP n=1 Tax=Polycladidibacter stylochi TaxID=1807766 RepID=UPI00083668C8|nr:protein-methionine-sulfoxide reductase catalytic subunit MsrP [Pseudovibrio stylochi]